MAQEEETKAPAAATGAGDTWGWGAGKSDFASYFSNWSWDGSAAGASNGSSSDRGVVVAGDATNADETKKQETNQWDSFYNNLMNDTDKNKDGKNYGLVNLLDAFTQKEDAEGEVKKQKGLSDLLRLVDTYGDEIKAIGEKYFGDITITNLDPVSLAYYLEKEDEIKNPSWKGRKHRYYPNLKTEDVIELNTYFHYADLAYNENEEEIKTDLVDPQHGGDPFDLVYAKTESEPNNPAFYVGVKRGTETLKDGCEILVSIRGTASIEDIITDVLCENVAYKNGGRAHKGILHSGQNITRLFQEILDGFIKEKSVEGTVQVLVVGHSLGGGTACIVGYELQEVENLAVKVVGFGTPGVVSKDLGANADYITTVVCDSDVVPRLSGYSVVNVVLDIMETDWLDKAKLDADLMLRDMQQKHSWLMSDSTRETTLARISDLLDSDVKPTIKEKTVDRREIILFPPGKCVHLWRNGSDISGSIVPGTFFDQIDVSRTMIDDHLCAGGYGKIFLELMRQHNQDPHFRFESYHAAAREAKAMAKVEGKK